MGKNTHLINIYLKIHNKKNLTMDDLRYLAKYDPECFEKTCENVVYNIPETKPIMTQAIFQPENHSKMLPELSETHNISTILENFKHLEANNYLYANVNAEDVKNLLGTLYMELLFPHNDRETFFNLTEANNNSFFDKKA